jgi:hypothetical protein
MTDRSFQGWATEPDADPIRMAALPLLVFVIEATTSDSAERKAAMGEVMSAVDRIRAAMRARPSFH